jgi:hypothetical protein
LAKNGHLVGAAATNFSHRSYQPVDEIDRVSCRPDFAIMAYPGGFYQIDKQRLSPTMQALPGVPPVFFVHAADDPVNGSAVENSVMFYRKGDHVDYLVNGHLHHPHGDHSDDHGPVN